MSDGVSTPISASPTPTTGSPDQGIPKYLEQSPIRGTSGIRAAAVFAAIHHVLPVPERSEVWIYLKTLWTLCERLALDSMVLAAQWDLETDTGRSEWWRERRNPAGIGVTGDPAQNEASQTWAGGVDAAYGHVAHMVAYVWGAGWQAVWPDDWLDPLEADRRFNAPIDAGYHAERLSDLNGTWAVDPQNNYDGKLAARANRIVDAVQGARPAGLVIP